MAIELWAVIRKKEQHSIKAMAVVMVVEALKKVMRAGKGPG